MRIIFGILTTSIFIAGAASAQLSPVLSPDQPVGATAPKGVSCYNPSNSSQWCVANYGVACSDNEEFDHCTSEQAAAWCPGPQPVTPTCAMCYAPGESGGGSCYADYGASCNPPTSTPSAPAPSHCTSAQAAAWCAGWTQKTQSSSSTSSSNL